MISLQTILLLCIGISHAVAWDPDCSICEYFNGIGYLKSDEFCGVYYMCVRNPYIPDSYRWYAMCCPEFMTFDVPHQTCIQAPYCIDSREKCANLTTYSPIPCPNYPDNLDDTKYFVPTGEQMMCPYGQVWNQPYCTCVRGEGIIEAPCDKILSYEFDATYDSWSCYNHAAGVPYGKPALNENMLCITGEDQFLSIPYLNNWFAWNPISKTFTLCFWFRGVANQTAGVLSTNCYSDQQGSVYEVCLEDGQLVLNLAGIIVYTNVYPPYAYWNKLCITFNRGVYIVYYNGVPLDTVETGEYPINSHSATTLGFVSGKKLFYGYFDDFCFWTRVLTANEIYDCYIDGPSNAGLFVLPDP